MSNIRLATITLLTGTLIGIGLSVVLTTHARAASLGSPTFTPEELKQITTHGHLVYRSKAL